MSDEKKYPKVIPAPLGLSEYACSDGRIYMQRESAEAHEKGLCQSELTSLRAQVERLAASLHAHERMTEASNEIFANHIKPIRHLWDEFNQPPGIGMICEKLAETTHRLEECEKANRFLRSQLQTNV